MIVNSSCKHTSSPNDTTDTKTDSVLEINDSGWNDKCFTNLPKESELYFSKTLNEIFMLWELKKINSLSNLNGTVKVEKIEEVINDSISRTFTISKRCGESESIDMTLIGEVINYKLLAVQENKWMFIDKFNFFNFVIHEDFFKLKKDGDEYTGINEIDGLFRTKRKLFLANEKYYVDEIAWGEHTDSELIAYNSKCNGKALTLDGKTLSNELNNVNLKTKVHFYHNEVFRCAYLWNDIAGYSFWKKK